MLHTIFIKCKVDVMYFIFISPSVPRFSVKKSVNQLIKINALINNLVVLEGPGKLYVSKQFFPNTEET